MKLRPCSLVQKEENTRESMGKFDQIASDLRAEMRHHVR